MAMPAPDVTRRSATNAKKWDMSSQTVLPNTNIVDPSTSSIADIKRHICFEVPQETDSHYFRENLLAQGRPHRWTYTRLRQTQNLLEAQKTGLRRVLMVERDALRSVYHAAAISAPKFAQDSAAFAEAFGDFLLHDNPKEVAHFAPLTSLKNQALRRAKGELATQLKHEDEPTIDVEPIEKPSLEPSALMPLGTRQAIWTALCPKRKCVSDFPFEVIVPSAAKLQEHVVDKLEDEVNSHSGRGKDTGQRKESRLANYVHPHVRIDIAQRKMSDGRSVHVLLLGLAEHAYNLRFSRLGLLQAYDMVVSWASRIGSDGVSISLKSAFDSCNQISEGIAASEEKLVSSAEDRGRRPRQWCENPDDLGIMGNDLLKQACQQALEAKNREWENKQGTDNANFDGGLDGSRPTKRTKY
ncbi:hypothetical protein LZ31DRAFT_583965 [Colletotrichum somersetense]|nr:hypothetical protein LZ31DRAFT_583965 [Colletotrichum somersetense]